MKIGVISDTHGCRDHWAKAYDKFFKDADLIIHSGDVLYHGPRNPMLEDYNPAELAEKINRDKSTATVLVRKLEKEGFIFMEKDSSDSRKKIIRLSEKGMKFNSATENLSRQLISSAFSSFSDNEKEELLSLLYRIYENLYDAV